MALVLEYAAVQHGGSKIGVHKRGAVFLNPRRAAIAVGLSCVVASLAYEPRADAPKAAAATEDTAEDARAERELESSSQ